MSRRKLHNVRRKQRDRYLRYIDDLERNAGVFASYPHSANWAEWQKTEDKSQRPWRLGKYRRVKPFVGRKKKQPRVFRRHPDCTIQGAHPSHEVEGRQDIDLCMGIDPSSTPAPPLPSVALAFIERKREEAAEILRQRGLK